jgi:hypothetical protein
MIGRADSVISRRSSAEWMVSEMIRPAVTTFLDMMLRERYRVSVSTSTRSRRVPFVGATAATRLEEKIGALVALRKGGRRISSTPQNGGPGREHVLSSSQRPA